MKNTFYKNSVTLMIRLLLVFHQRVYMKVNVINLRKVSFFSLERVNKLQMKNSFTENKRINEKETFFRFAVSW